MIEIPYGDFAAGDFFMIFLTFRFLYAIFSMVFIYGWIKANPPQGGDAKLQILAKGKEV